MEASYGSSEDGEETGKKFQKLILNWTREELKQDYEKAIKHYIPENNWRLVN